MITHLRRRHRQLWLLVAPASVGIIALSVGLRPEQAVVARLPGVLTEARASAEGAPEVVPGVGQVARAVVSGAPGVSLRYETALRVPDPLLYWSPEAAGEGLPTDAVLVGALDGTEADLLPLDRDGGHLSIFSLGRGEVLATFPMPRGAP